MAIQYKVESIGAAFSPKQMTQLSSTLTSQAANGWELHDVFSVTQTGCMGSSTGQTYLAVYRKED